MELAFFIFVEVVYKKSSMNPEMLAGGLQLFIQAQYLFRQLLLVPAGIELIL